MLSVTGRRDENSSLLPRIITVFAETLHADTYTVNVPCAGNYSAGQGYSTNLDFGQAFSSIQSMSIAWSGTIKAGHTYGDPLDPFDNQALPGSTLAYLYNDDMHIAWNAGVSGGLNTHPTPEPFDTTSSFVDYPGNRGSWDILPPPQVIQPSYKQNSLLLSPPV